MEQNKKETTGVWVFQNADQLESFFIRKDMRERVIGRKLTENETHELLVEMNKAGEVGGGEIAGNKGDVKAIISEHFNAKTIRKLSDLEDLK